jgi:hypothetical protein
MAPRLGLFGLGSGHESPSEGPQDLCGHQVMAGISEVNVAEALEDLKMDLVRIVRAQICIVL